MTSFTEAKNEGSNGERRRWDSSYALCVCVCLWLLTAGKKYLGSLLTHLGGCGDTAGWRRNLFSQEETNFCVCVGLKVEVVLHLWSYLALVSLEHCSSVLFAPCNTNTTDTLRGFFVHMWASLTQLAAVLPTKALPDVLCSWTAKLEKERHAERELTG